MSGNNDAVSGHDQSISVNYINSRCWHSDNTQFYRLSSHVESHERAPEISPPARPIKLVKRVLRQAERAAVNELNETVPQVGVRADSIRCTLTPPVEVFQRPVSPAPGFSMLYRQAGKTKR